MFRLVFFPLLFWIRSSVLLARMRCLTPHLQDRGECEVKHGVRVHITNLFTQELGNPEPPQKFKRAGVEAAVPAAKPASSQKYLLIAAAIIIGAVTAGILLFRPRRVPKTVPPLTAIPEK